MLEAGGTCVHVHAATHEGVESADAPPHAAIAELVREYLGPVRKAGQGHLPQGTAGGESEIYRAAGFSGPRRIEIPGRLVGRTTDEVVAKVYSLSSSTPHLFGDRRADFEAGLRQLLHNASPTGTFRERMRETALDIWRP